MRKVKKRKRENCDEGLAMARVPRGGGIFFPSVVLSAVALSISMIFTLASASEQTFYGKNKNYVTMFVILYQIEFSSNSISYPSTLVFDLKRQLRFSNHPSPPVRRLAEESRSGI